MRARLPVLEDASRSGHVSRDVGYRPDIDGLRAVAVMLVVLNHAGAALFSGGFVGVDVFFVISGFLITALISVQRREGRFSFGDFYLRRAKRLLPALYVLMLVVIVAGYWLLTPSDYSLLAQSALSAVGLASNVFFWLNTGGYFSPDAGAFPLLHIWSLSLEEQFYLIWPAALLALLHLRSPVSRLAVVFAAAALSLASAEYGVRTHALWHYFLLPSRAGEFLLGALVYLVWRPRGPNPVLANACSAAGISIVLAAAVVLGPNWPFPGFNAVWPCLGAALIVAAPQFGPSVVTRLLSTRPFVYVGLISYSVYLWHWPLVSFLRISRIEITPLLTAGIVVTSLLLGWASWWFLERGYRGLLDRMNRPALAAGAVVAAAVLAAPTYILARSGLPERFPYALLTQDQLNAERGRYWHGLQSNGLVLSAPGPKHLLIVGDSHAYDLAYALNTNGYPGQLRLIESFFQCFNFGHDPVLPGDTAMCRDRRQIVLSSPELRTANAVYLHDHWGGYNEAGLADMIGQIRAVTSAPIYVFGPKMVFIDDVLLISKKAQSQRYVTLTGINGFSRQYENSDVAQRDRQLAAFFRSHRFADVHYVSMLDVQCGPQLACDIISPEGKYLYFDAGHFTLEGARRFGRRLRQMHPELF